MTHYKIFEPKGTWNGKLVALSDGHGMDLHTGKMTPYITELKRRIKENEFNAPVVDFLTEELTNNGFRVLQVAYGDHDVPLKKRTDIANKFKADIYVAIHYNAHDGKFDGAGIDPEGLEIWVYLGNLKYNSGRLANAVAKYLKQGTPQRWRGIKEGNLHEVRETKMPAILTENGFMDNEREALLMLDVNFQKEVATEHAKGICDYFGVAYRSLPASKPKPAPVKEEPTVKNPGVFPDVPKNHYAHDSIAFLKELGIINGYPNGNFGTNDTLTRAQGAVMVAGAIKYLLKEQGGQ